MNPENMGPHLTMRHSSLWRKPLLYEKSNPNTSVCHTQMNELGATGVSWRVRNNSIPSRLHKSSKLSTTKQTVNNELSEILAQNKNNPQQASQILQTIRDDVNLIDKSDKLISGVRQLKKMKLLHGRMLQRTKFPGIVRYNYVHNDYHERITNPGYSRNFLGKFYTR